MFLVRVMSLFFLASPCVHAIHLRSNITNTVFSPLSPYNAGNAFVNCTNYNQYTNQCNYHGMCLSNGYCKCDTGYITWPSDNKVGCTYVQKSQLVTFLLSFFLGKISGAGEWYAGNTDMALAQLLLFALGVVTVCVLAIWSEGVSVCFNFLWCLAIIILWFYVWINVAVGNTTDGNGAPLNPM